MGLSYLAGRLVKELSSKEPFTCLKHGARNAVESYGRTENISICSITYGMAFVKRQFLEFLL